MGFLPSTDKSHRNARDSTVEHTIISKFPDGPSTEDYEGVQALSCSSVDRQSRLVPPVIKEGTSGCGASAASPTICRSSNQNCLVNTQQTSVWMGEASPNKPVYCPAPVVSSQPHKVTAVDHVLVAQRLSVELR